MTLHISLDIQRFAAGLSIASSVTSQSIPNNNSVVNITVTIKRTSGSTNWTHPYERTLTINCDGQSYSVATELPSNKTSVTYSHEFTVPHNADGTKYIEYSASLPKTSSFPALSASGSATLPTIPRQPSFNSISASSITETSVRLTASIDTHSLGITDGGWDVSTNGGASWTYYSGGPTDKTITGLQPNTQYWYRGYCATAGGSSNSGWGTFTTYDYPKANAVNDLILKADTTFTIGFSNPLSKTFSYQIISNVDSSVIYTSGDVNITSATLNMNDLLDEFYETIPSAKEGTYYVKTTCSGNIRNSISKKYTVDAATCKPTMSVVGYEDINSTTLALTGNNQKLIVGYSTIKVTVADGNKATPQYNATITGYKIKNGEYLSPIVPEVEGEDVILTCPATAGIIEVYAIDSREQTGIYQIVNTTMINYEPIQKDSNPKAERCDSQGDPNGVGEYVKITLSGEFWNNSFGTITNTIKSITYEYANAKYPEQTTPGTTTITETTDYNEFDVEQLILGDTQHGFDIGNSYIINVTVSDELSSTTFTMTLGSGTPHIAYSPNGVSIMGKYNDSKGGLLQVAGEPLEIPTINDSYSTSQTETYSCAYSNAHFQQFPIGYIYISAINTSPASLFGGTWVQLKSRYLYATGNEGGSGADCGKDNMSTYTGTGTQSHTLTANQSGLRWHDHSINLRLIYCAKGSSDYWTVPWGSGDQGTMSTNGNGGWNAAEGHSHNVSYVAVYVWQKTA